MASKIVANLKYLQWQDLYNLEKPYQLFIDLPAEVQDRRISNLVFETHAVEICDIRDRHEYFTLDEHGFTVCNHTTKVTDFQNRQMVEEQYLGEVEDIVRSHLDDAERIFVFNWRLRNTDPELPGQINLNDPTEFRRPATHLHVDSSPAAVLNRIKLQFKDDADELLRGRLRSINVWRPIVSEVGDWALALCDGSSVNPEDLVETDHVQRKYTGPTMYSMYNAAHRYYYMGGQRMDEVTIFKIFDSREGVCRYAPHAAFRDPVIRPNGQPRKSIEVRCLVFSPS